MTTRSEMAQVMSDVFSHVPDYLDTARMMDDFVGRKGGLSLKDMYVDLRGTMEKVHAWICRDHPSQYGGADQATTNCLMAISVLVQIYARTVDLPPDSALSKVRDKCDAFREAGQKEYAHADDNAFANFERIAGYLTKMGVTREAVLCVYLEKHLDGIKSWVDGHRSQRESVHGRICDAIVYITLLVGMIRSRPSA